MGIGDMRDAILLASASPWRRQMLEATGLAISAEPARIDERATGEPLERSGATAGELAVHLARAKAEEVSRRFPNALVLGADQVLSLDGAILHKARNIEEGRDRLLQLSGRTHRLSSAIALSRNGEPVWHHVGIAEMTMRELDTKYIDDYLAKAGDQVLGSVGVYQIEGPGIQLFDRIQGDHWTIIGLPLLPLLSKLRDMGVIDG